MKLTVAARVETFPIAGTFVISRGSRTEAHVVVAEVSDGQHTGRGECVPYARYGETVGSVIAVITGAGPTADREELRCALPYGAARNALDCALWDLEAKRSGQRAWVSAGLPVLQPVTTAYTLSLGTPESMEDAARIAAVRPLLKVKLGGEGDGERIRAVRRGAPQSRLIVDANEAWRAETFEENMLACREAGVAAIEQPLPAGADDLLRGVAHPVPIYADESIHVAADLDGLAGKYDGINIKLDKAGGLTEGLDLLRQGREHGYLIMIGCMVGTSLAMAPALLLAQDADFVDLDGPLLLARDRQPGLTYSGAEVSPPTPDLWG